MLTSVLSKSNGHAIRRGYVRQLVTAKTLRLGHSSGSLQNPELKKPRHAGHGEQCDRRDEPSTHMSARHERHDASEHGAACSDRCDNIADPVNEVEKRAFRLRSRLTLDSHTELRRCTQSLRPQIRSA